MTTALARSSSKSRAKNNPLSGGEKLVLGTVGVLAVGAIGGGIYYATRKPSASSASGSSSANTNTPPSALLPANMAANPSTSVAPGKNYVVAAVIAGLDMATGAPIGGATAQTESQLMAALGVLGWSNVSVLWWGPTSTLNDPNGFLNDPRLAPIKAWKGTYAFTSTYTGQATPLPAQGVTAYQIG